MGNKEEKKRDIVLKHINDDIINPLKQIQENNNENKIQARIREKK